MEIKLDKIEAGILMNCTYNYYLRRQKHRQQDGKPEDDYQRQLGTLVDKIYDAIMKEEGLR